MTDLADGPLVTRGPRAIAERISLRARALGAVLAAATSAGCGALLPDNYVQTRDIWGSYQQAKASIDKIEPFVTDRGALAELGIDPAKNPAVTVLTYSDIVGKFSAMAPIGADDYDAGIRRCLLAGKGCTGYAIAVRHAYRERVGNFVTDWLNFRRETNVTGWSFNATVLIVDDVVVYAMAGGEPNLREFDLQRNPLGPLQNAPVPSTIR